jgi:hypothetical protein
MVFGQAGLSSASIGTRQRKRFQNIQMLQIPQAENMPAVTAISGNVKPCGDPGKSRRRRLCQPAPPDSGFQMPHA